MSEPISSAAATILVVDDTPENLRLLLGLFQDTGFTVATANSGKMALDSVHQVAPDLILLDVKMPEMDGYEVCRRLKADPAVAGIPVLFISALDQQEDRLSGFAAGGADYINKPFFPEEVLARVQTHLNLRQSLIGLQKQKEELEREKAEREKTEQELGKYQERMAGILARQLLRPKAFKSIITKSEKMYSLFQYIEALACSHEPVLITGESGAGKELIARAVHDACSPESPWVAVNIAGFEENVFSDTLFGHVKGAFTGAEHDRPGMIELARGGTLFLDEIGDLCPSSQVKLLRLLQEKEYLPLGCDTPRKIAARILVATNADLKEKMAGGEFRQDLFYRLSAHHIEIPSLRQRKEDIPLLVDFFMEKAARELKKKKPTYPAELPVLLRNYDFPGNIRELRALVFDAVSKHQGRMLSMSSFVEKLQLESTTVDSEEDRIGRGICFGEKLPTLKEVPTLLIQEALQRTEGKQSMAAKLLGVTPAALSQRLKKMAE